MSPPCRYHDKTSFVRNKSEVVKVVQVFPEERIFLLRRLLRMRLQEKRKGLNRVVVDLDDVFTSLGYQDKRIESTVSQWNVSFVFYFVDTGKNRRGFLNGL
ncbi:unnamed protein product [Sphenostylis stenocarpa]|uniref:Uncharacterized protein n=1 Tax=Sphenostylis stenocarpa TaxID=92480 RepID=A0AA86S2T0_9FABA|nr:unnamed protein product [Sphenostylis stenocarpa]